MIAAGVLVVISLIGSDQALAFGRFVHQEARRPFGEGGLFFSYWPINIGF